MEVDVVGAHGTAQNHRPVEAGSGHRIARLQVKPLHLGTGLSKSVVEATGGLRAVIDQSHSHEREDSNAADRMPTWQRLHRRSTGVGQVTGVELSKVGSGKVRDLYAIDDQRLLLVASDRISAYDVVLGRHHPRQGSGADRALALLLRLARDTQSPAFDVPGRVSERLATWISNG